MLKKCALPRPYDLPEVLKVKGLGVQGSKTFAAIASEMGAFNDLDSNETLAAKRTFGAIPLIVLRSGHHQEPGRAGR